MINTLKSILLPFLSIFLFSCSRIPETVKIEGILYRTGFYGDLYPINLTYDNIYYEANGNKYRRVDSEMFNLIKFSNDGTVQDVLYCAENQWEQAYQYYMNRDNFIYYCRIGQLNIHINPEILILSEMDHKKFDDLMLFADKNEYKPFNKKNENVQRLPFPDKDEYPELVFYRESKDTHFTTTLAHKFYVINEQLLLLYYYDYGYGEYQELVTIIVPVELAQYFIVLFRQSILKNNIIE